MYLLIAKIMVGPILQFQGRNFEIGNAATWELGEKLKLVQNVPINCKIEFDLKVGFAIYQVQYCSSELVLLSLGT